MNNPADLMEVCKTILAYQENGDPSKDVIEQTPYSEEELIHELALFYVSERVRCVAIVNAARSGEIDGDLRCIRSRIESGEAFPEPVTS